VQGGYHQGLDCLIYCYHTINVIARSGEEQEVLIQAVVILIKEGGS
jgi:hypothetical protein